MNRARITEWAAMAAALSRMEASMFSSSAAYTPTPEKYPGQRQAFRRGAWKGDGVPPDPARSRGRKCTQP